ncbi:MAG: hypothetical protein HY898_12580 [Deltaproteobacteria bacterium]|nr:hypothetical protein [Deltaproteobacteria bacterium]
MGAISAVEAAALIHIQWDHGQAHGDASVADLPRALRSQKYAAMPAADTSSVPITNPIRDECESRDATWTQNIHALTATPGVMMREGQSPPTTRRASARPANQTPGRARARLA